MDGRPADDVIEGEFVVKSQPTTDELNRRRSRLLTWVILSHWLKWLGLFALVTLAFLGLLFVKDAVTYRGSTVRLAEEVKLDSGVVVTRSGKVRFANGVEEAREGLGVAVMTWEDYQATKEVMP